MKTTGAAAALGAATALGLLLPMRVMAAEWNRAAFGAKDLPGALHAAGMDAAAESADLVLKAPDVAEDGAAVPIEVISNLPGTQEISIFVDDNPFPLAASFRFSNGAEPRISARLKMAETSNVRVVARAADGKFYSTVGEVKVTIGGCG